MSSGIFITGTDTGVGKTVVTAGIASLILKKGHTVGVMKPVQTGMVLRQGKPVSEDLEFIKSVIDKNLQSAEAFSNPYLFKKPLAPNQAAKAEKRSVKIPVIQEEYHKLAAKKRFVIVEGAGGLLVPLNQKEFMSDLVLALDIPIIVVARPNLGTINHTLLTIRSAREMGIRVLGLVFNYSSKENGEGEKEAVDFIHKYTGVPVLGTIPFFPNLDVAGMKHGNLGKKFKMDLKPILKLSVAAAAKELRALEIQKMDKTYVWHPFTQMRDWLKEDALIIEKGEGSYLMDTHGNRYLDGISSIWVTTHGHRREEINRGIRSQLNKVAHSTLLGLGNIPSAQLAQKLIDIVPPNLKKVFYSDAGSTAVEVALKMAFLYWRHKNGGNGKRAKFIYLDQSYHGDTIGSMGVGGIELFHDLFKRLLFDSYKVPNPHCYRCSLKKTFPSCRLACADEAEKVLKAHAGEIAALIIEPMVQGAAGMIVFPDGYMKKVARLCKKYGILLIADEVAVGFGRTGKMFACEHEGVRPDILCVAKGITGGYLPLAATITTEAIFSAFLGEYKEFKTFFHGHTFTGNPLACAAALENIELFRKEKTLEKTEKKVEQIKKGLERFKDLKHVGDIRQSGLMVGVELVKDKATREPFPLEEKVGIRVIQEARRRGAIIRPLGNVVVLVPHLTFSRKEIRILLDVLYESIEEVLG